MNQFICISGCTASGKSSFALKLSKYFENPVIINTDALQIYECWEILTDRPSVKKPEHALYGHVSCSKNYSVGEWIKDVKEMVGNNKVICALSGGVDSSVVAQLLNKAIGKKLHCIFVNTGLLRKDEEKQVVATFKKRLKINLTYVNAEKEFISKLSNISDPEKKKKDNRKPIYKNI